MSTRHTALTILAAAGLGLGGLSIAAAQPDPNKPTAPPTQPPGRSGWVPGGDASRERGEPGKEQPGSRQLATMEQVARVTEGWGAQQREAVRKMSDKYGMPSDATENMIAWRDVGQFKKISVSREAVPHEFPVAHPDFLMHTVSYRIPADKVSDLIASDGSLQVDRTGGCLSAKCDTEPHNLLSLNLAHDILTGKKSVQQARDEHAKIAMGEKDGKSHPYLEKLQFQPQSADARDPDQAHKPGDPVPAGTNRPGEKSMDRK